MMTNPPNNKSIKTQLAYLSAQPSKATMQLSLPMDRLEQERPSPWKGLDTTYMTIKGGSYPGQLKIFLIILEPTKVMKSHTWSESPTSKSITKS